MGLAPNSWKLTEVRPRQMWWGRLGFYLLFALHFSWILRQGAIFFGEGGLYRRLGSTTWVPPQYWLPVAIAGILFAVVGLALHIAGKKNLWSLLACLMLFALFGRQAGPYHTQANYFFACLVIITLPISVWPGSTPAGHNPIRSLPFFLFLSFFYVLVAFKKCHGYWLPGGLAMQELAQSPLIVTEWGRALFSTAWAQVVLAPGVVITEFLLAAGIFSGIFFRPARQASAIGMVVFHLALLLFTDIGYFPLYSLLAGVLLFSPAPVQEPKDLLSQGKAVVAMLLLAGALASAQLHDFSRWWSWNLISYPQNVILNFEIQDPAKASAPSFLLRQLPNSFFPFGEFAGPFWHLYFMQNLLDYGWEEGAPTEFPQKGFARYLCARDKSESLLVKLWLKDSHSTKDQVFLIPCR